MKKVVENIRKNLKDELMKTGLVLLGAISGTAIIKGARMLSKDNPTADAILEYSLPFVVTGGGIIIASATERDSKVKFFGYGLAAAGAIEGVKLIPVAGDFFAGLLGSTEIASANSFYTEDEQREKIMQGFGLSELSVASATMQPAKEMDARLPELEGATVIEDTEDLGYNSSSTSDADDFKGVL